MFMTQTKFDSSGRYTGTQQVVRDDAQRYDGHLRCFTTAETKWVSSWAEFKAAGGEMLFAEDATEIHLRLPAPYKFACGFNRNDA